MYIIVHGSVLFGFRFIGPFTTAELAWEWTRTEPVCHEMSSHYWVAKLDHSGDTLDFNIMKPQNNPTSAPAAP